MTRPPRFLPLISLLISLIVPPVVAPPSILEPLLTYLSQHITPSPSVNASALTTQLSSSQTIQPTPPNPVQTVPSALLAELTGRYPKILLRLPPPHLS